MNTILEIAKKFIGIPYVWGGESTKEGGFDCSGYVYNVLISLGLNVPRDTAQGYYNRFKGNQCNINTPGALLFFGKSKDKITHIAINIDGKYMYESIGNRTNTKSKPGKGVTKSLITRRKDLVAVCSIYKNVSRETFAIPKPTLRRGNMGIEVNKLQVCLNKLGANLNVDGQFGQLTYKALVNFQKQHKNELGIDGVYGKHTERVMRGVLNGN